MKPKLVLSLIISFFIFVGCDKKYEDPGVMAWVPSVFIEYVNRDGVTLVKPDGKNIFKEKYPIENLSITKENGEIYEFRNSNCFCILIDIFDGFRLDSLNKTLHQYNIKYQIPTLFGESVQEVKLLYWVDGMNTKFTNAWYNNNEILRFVTIDMIVPSYPNGITDEDVEMIERRKKELLYNGDTVALIEGSDIHLIIPIDN